MDAIEKWQVNQPDKSARGLMQLADGASSLK
jgi:hypothetical protein